MREANFLYVRRLLMRLARKFVTIAGFVIQERICNGPVERRPKNFIDGGKLSSYDEYNYEYDG